MKNNKTAKFLTFILLVLAMNTIYVLPYLMYTYYTPLQEAMGLVGRDADYGKLLNVYGIANVILYLPGGWIADKFNPKKLLDFCMISTGILGLWEATCPSYSMLMLIHVLWAVTTVLTFWSSSVKCVNLLADADEQGSMFGSLAAMRGVVGLIVTTICVGLFNLFRSDSSKAMGSIVAVVSVIMIAVGIALALLMPKFNNLHATNDSLLDSIKAMGVAFKLPITYVLAGLIFCGSMTYASSSYYAPYLQKFCAMPTEIAVTFTNYRAIICQLIAASLAAVLPAHDRGRHRGHRVLRGHDPRSRLRCRTVARDDPHHRRLHGRVFLPRPVLRHRGRERHPQERRGQRHRHRLSNRLPARHLLHLSVR